MGFAPDWLAARACCDEAALNQQAVAAIRAWGTTLPDEAVPTVVDLGSGTGVALERVRRWLGSRSLAAYAVDRDADLLMRVNSPAAGPPPVPILGDVLRPLDGIGGPSDGTVDLVTAHALADLLPLDRLATRVAALLRGGGLAHLALVYDGLTALTPVDDASLDTAVLAAFHRHMDRPSCRVPTYGGSTAGRRLGPALAAAGLEVLVDMPSVWSVCADRSRVERRVLEWLIRFVVDASREVGDIPDSALACWEAERRTALAAGTLTARVGHRDLLARKPADA